MLSEGRGFSRAVSNEMSRPSRVHNFGSYFTTVQAWERRTLFNVDVIATLFVETLYQYRSRGKILLHEFVVMPDHVHLIITPCEIEIAMAMQFIKGGFSHAVGMMGRRSEVWQKGFTDHRIRDWDDLVHHRNYLRRNPVKRGLCSIAEEFVYSSANPKFELDDIPVQLWQR